MNFTFVLVASIDCLVLEVPINNSIIVKQYLIPFSELDLRQEDIYSEMGYKNVSPEPYLTDSLQEFWPLLQHQVTAECVFRIENGSFFTNGINILDIELNTRATITSLLENSISFAIFAATAGHRFEEMINCVKNEDDILKIYLMDIIGTCIADKAGEKMVEYLEKEIGDMKHTNPFSPGYCGWHLTEQRKIFGLLGGNPCGISLSEVCLMTPIKSISGIIGIGENVKTKQYACNYCELDSCYKKKSLTDKIFEKNEKY